MGQGSEFVTLLYPPVIEGADEVKHGSMWRPLADHPSVIGAVQPEIEISGGKIGQTPLPGQGLFFMGGLSLPAPNRFGKRLQPGIVLYKKWVFHITGFLDKGKKSPDMMKK